MWATMEVDERPLDANPDIQFFDALVEHLSERFDIDLGRVYVVGMSNGASFVQLLTAARPNKIAAAAAHSGPDLAKIVRPSAVRRSC
jgi:poly(3-hydroxybutyrate) depolymerase